MARLREDPSYRLFKMDPNGGAMTPVGTVKNTALECFQMMATIGHAFLDKAPDLSAYGVYRQVDGGWERVDTDQSGHAF